GLKKERRAGEERSIAEDLQPPESRTVRLTEWRTGSEASLDRGAERLGSDRCVDTNGQPAAVREVADDRDPAREVDVRDQLGQVVDRDDPVREQASAVG